jgi:Ni/Fe-hydrogenase subunit HybB-like protein
MLIGVVIPFLLFSSHKVRNNHWYSLVAAMFLLAGVVLNRFNTSWWALMPNPDYHYMPSLTETMILIGVLSGAILTFLVVARYFPVYKELSDEPQSATKAPASPAVAVAGGGGK